MTASTHLKRKPHSRGTTIANLVKQDAIHQELRQGLKKRTLFQKLRATLHAALGRR